MFNTLLNLDPVQWWVIPSLVVCLGFLLIMRHDDKDNLELGQWLTLIVVSIAWPVGAVVLVTLLSIHIYVGIADG